MGTKARATGSDVVLLGAFEATYGTAPNGAGGGVYTRLSFKSSDLGAEQPLGYDPLLGQGRDAQDPYYDAITDDGELEIPLDLRATGFWLKALFGAPVSTDNGDGSHSHVFTSGGALPSLALQVGHPQLAVAEFEMHAGVVANTLSFDMARTGPANAKLGVIAQGETSGATAADASPLAFALSRLSQGNGSIKMGGSPLAYVTGGSFNFSNNCDPVATIRPDGMIDGVDAGEAKASGSIEVRHSTDATIPNAVKNKTPVSLEYGYSVAGSAVHGLTITMPRVFLPKKKKSITGPGGIAVTYEWQAAYDASAGYMCRVTLVNDVDGY